MTAKRDDFLARLDAQIRILHSESGWHDESARTGRITGLLIARRIYLNQPPGPSTRDQALADALAGPLLDPDEPLNLTPAEAAQLEQEPEAGDEPERRCPDDGKCWHACTTGCWRVLYCAPLSIAGWGETWPEDIRAANEVSDGVL